MVVGRVEALDSDACFCFFFNLRVQIERNLILESEARKYKKLRVGVSTSIQPVGPRTHRYSRAVSKDGNISNALQVVS